MGDNIFYWMLSIILILLVCIPLAYKLGLSTGYRNGFQYGYDNNPLKNTESKAISDIKFLLKDFDLYKEAQITVLKILKQLNDLDKLFKDVQTK